MTDRDLQTRLDTGELQALNRSLATIVFAADGTILRANEPFLSLFGYASREIIGLNHRIFVPGIDITLTSNDFP